MKHFQQILENPDVTIKQLLAQNGLLSTDQDVDYEHQNQQPNEIPEHHLNVQAQNGIGSKETEQDRVIGNLQKQNSLDVANRPGRDPEYEFLNRFQNRYQNAAGLFNEVEQQPIWRQTNLVRML